MKAAGTHEHETRMETNLDQTRKSLKGESSPPPLETFFPARLLIIIWKMNGLLPKHCPQTSHWSFLVPGKFYAALETPQAISLRTSLQ